MNHTGRAIVALTTSRRVILRWITLATTMAMVAGVLPWTAFGEVSRAVAAPASISVGTVETRVAQMANADANYRYVSPIPGGGSSTSPWTAWVTSQEARVSHGWNGDSPGSSLSTTRQSVIGVTPNQAGSVTEASPFLLAQFNHYNNPIQSAAQHQTSTLELRFLSATFSLGWSLHETPNSWPCPTGSGWNNIGCDDILTFDTDVPATIVNAGGYQYRLVITGFVNQATCPATIAADAPTEETFVTVESTTTHGCLYATLDRIRDLTIVKKVTLPDGSNVPAGVTIPTFSFTTDSNIAGSQWHADFGLTPTGSTTHSVTREILSSEKITMSEALPSGDQWSLGSLACVDQNGSAVPWVNGNGANTLAPPTLVIDDIVELTTTPDKITCTYTNVYTPKATLTLKKVVSGGTLQPSSFTLAATGPTTTISGPGNGTAVNNQRVNTGTYTLSETIPSGSGYVQDGLWSCTAGGQNLTVTNSQVTVADGQYVTCTVTNRFATGAVKVEKVIQDPNGGYSGTASTPFTGNVSCTTPTGSYPWSASTGTPWTQGGVRAGSICSAVETQPTGNLKDSSYRWLNPEISAAVTVTDGTTQTITVTNKIVRDFGYLAIAKTVAGPGGYTGTAARTFPITYSCSLGGSVVASGAVNQAHGTTSTSIAVPLGANCTFGEVQPTTQTGDFADASYHWLAPTIPASVTIASTHTQAAPAKVAVTNTYERQYGSIILAKSVSGPGAATLATSKRFTLTYDCGTGFTGSVDVAAGASSTVSNLPLNANCTIAENPVPTGNDGLAPAYQWAASGAIAYSDRCRRLDFSGRDRGDPVDLRHPR